MLLILGITLAGRGIAQATLKRALFYGPTSYLGSTPGHAEEYVNAANSPFAPIGPGATDSKVWSESEWLTKTTADFAQFDIIVFGDEPRDQNTSRDRWITATANRAVWSAAVNGNVLIFGGDPDDLNHKKKELVYRAMDFGADQSGYGQHVTGLYFALGQVEFGIKQGNTLLPETVELLEAIGEFKAISADADLSPTDQDGNWAFQIATHPVLDCLQDGYLYRWNASCHVGFLSWPSTFMPLALVTDAKVSTPGYFPHCYSYEGPDCDISALCYILARGGFVRELTASPCLATAAVTESKTITAQFKTVPGGVPITGRKIQFNVEGANAGATGVNVPSNGETDANGKVTFTYAGSAAGKDTVRVFVDDNPGPIPPVRDLCEPGTVAVVNWGAPTVTVTAPDAVADESGSAGAGTGIFRFSRSPSTGSAVTVAFCISGTASSADTDLPAGTVTIPGGLAYKDVIVTAVNDALVEGTETLRVTLKDDANDVYAVGAPFTAEMTILDNDAGGVVTIAASGTATEVPAGYGQPPAPVDITFSRTGSAAQMALLLTIFFDLPVASGSARLGADYKLDAQTLGEITFQPYQASKIMKLTPLQDSRDEGDESVQIRILPDTSYQLGTPSTVTLTIADDDAADLNFSYTITALGPANRLSHAFGINNNGRVTGDYNPFASGGDWRGFSWGNGSLTMIGVPGSNPDCSANIECGQGVGLGINDSGVVVGWGGPFWTSFTGASLMVHHPFKWTSGAPVVLGRLATSQPFGNQAVAINNNGDIVGFSKNSLGKTHAVLWSAGTTAALNLQTLAGVDDTKESFAAGIGFSGKIVGKSMISTDNTTFHAFRTLTLLGIQPSDDLGNLVGGEGLNSEATWINEWNEVVGATTTASGQYHAFWKDGSSAKNQGFIDLGVLVGDNQSVALGLNKAGFAVGYSLNIITGNKKAVVWFNNGEMHELISLVGNPTGWTLKSAEAINNDGWIVGWGLKGGIERGFLLVPNAE